METLNQNLVFDIQLGAIRGDGQARKALEEITSNAVGRGLVNGVRGSSSALERDMKRVMASAFKVGLRQEGRALHKVFAQGASAIQKARENVSRIEAQMLRATDQSHRNRLMRERTAQQSLITDKEKFLKKQVKSLESSAGRFGDMIETASRNASKHWADSVEKGGKKFASLIEGALDMGNIDPSKLATSLGQGVKDNAGNMAAFGAKHGGKAGAMGGMGKAATALAGAAGAIAGVAAAFGAVLAVLGAAYGQTKELNTGLMAAASGADMLGNAMDRNSRGDLGKTLEDLRGAAISLQYQMRFTSEEAIETISSFNDAGMSVRLWGQYVGEAGDQAKIFGEMAYTAAKYATAFGVSAQEFAGHSTMMFKDYGKNLDTVESGLGAIFVNAQKANMSTKAFFTAVTEASTGMSLYNFRLDDTVGLLTNMTKILGEDLGKAQAGLQGSYTGMDTTQRINTIMNAGGAARSRSIQKVDLTGQMGEFKNSFGDLFGQLGNTFSGLLDGSGDMSGSALASMSEQDFGRMLLQMRESGDVRQIAGARQLESMRGLAGGAYGRGIHDVAGGMGFMSRSGELAQQLSEASTLVPGGISNHKGMNRQAYENMTGRTGDDYEILVRLDRDMRARFAEAGGAAGTEMSFSDFVTQNAGSFGAAADHGTMPAMERLAREELTETRSISNILKGKIAGALDSIGNAVFGIFSFMGSGDESGTNRIVAMEALQDQMDVLLESTSNELDHQAELKETLEGTTDPWQRRALEGQILSSEGTVSDNDRLLEIKGDAIGRIARTGRDDVSEDVMGGIQAETGAATRTGMREILFEGMSPEDLERVFAKTAEFNNIEKGFVEGWLGQDTAESVRKYEGDDIYGGASDNLLRAAHAIREETDGSVNPGRRAEVEAERGRAAVEGSPIVAVQREGMTATEIGDLGTPGDNPWAGVIGGGGMSFLGDGGGDYSGAQYGAEALIEAYRSGGDPNWEGPTNAAGSGGEPQYFADRGVEWDKVWAEPRGPFDFEPTDNFGADGSRFGGSDYPYVANMPNASGDAQGGRMFLTAEQMELIQEGETEALAESLAADQEAHTTAMMTEMGAIVNAGDGTTTAVNATTRAVNSLNATLTDQLMGTLAGAMGANKDLVGTNMGSSTGRRTTGRQIGRMTQGQQRDAAVEAFYAAGGQASDFGRGGRPAVAVQQDFVKRPGMPVISMGPGQADIPFSSNDTIVGTKGAGSRGRGGGPSINIFGGDQSVVYNTVRRAMKSQGR